MRLTDEQIAGIRESAAYENDDVTKWQLRGLAFALLADREALVAEIAELKTRMAEGFSARDGQIENGAKMIADLRSMGFAIAPLEPTEKMMEAADLQLNEAPDNNVERDIYRAMIAAYEKEQGDG